MCIYAFCFCDFVFVFFCARYFSDLFISCFSVLSEFRFDLTFLMTDTTHSLSSSISLLVLLFSYESRTREGIYALLCFAVLYGVLKSGVLLYLALLFALPYSPSFTFFTSSSSFSPCTPYMYINCTVFNSTIISYHTRCVVRVIYSYSDFSHIHFAFAFAFAFASIILRFNQVVQSICRLFLRFCPSCPFVERPVFFASI